MPSARHPLSLHDALSDLLDPEGRSLPGLALEADPAAVGLDDLASERKAETGPGDALRGRTAAVELGEHLLLLFGRDAETPVARSEEHTSELQSLTNLVCRPPATPFPYTTLFPIYSIQKVDPSPASLSKPIRPPWASTISRASARPRPVPGMPCAAARPR